MTAQHWWTWTILGALALVVFARRYQPQRTPRWQLFTAWVLCGPVSWFVFLVLVVPMMRQIWRASRIQRTARQREQWEQDANRIVTREDLDRWAKGEFDAPLPPRRRHQSSPERK